MRSTIWQVEANRWEGTIGPAAGGLAPISYQRHRAVQAIGFANPSAELRSRLTRPGETAAKEHQSKNSKSISGQRRLPHHQNEMCEMLHNQVGRNPLDNLAPGNLSLIAPNDALRCAAATGAGHAQEEAGASIACVPYRH
ncbi:hypothetical protein [Bradyrhizobium tunisiense]|uniref:hypothetical protein n=1 Tax=Bradyrhizobium tunisiense TaxID=3278709 RepID=UPI0035DD0787